MSLVTLSKADEVAVAPLSPTLLLLRLFMKRNSISFDTVYLDTLGMLTLIF